MTNYNSSREMVASESLQKRITASAAEEGVLAPDQWVRDQIWYLAVDDEWDARWSDANFNYNPTFNPDTGERPDVITDAIISRAVKERITHLQSLEP
jgi:hypothetical protein